MYTPRRAKRTARTKIQELMAALTAQAMPSTTSPRIHATTPSTTLSATQTPKNTAACCTGVTAGRMPTSGAESSSASVLARYSRCPSSRPRRAAARGRPRGRGASLSHRGTSSGAARRSVGVGATPTWEVRRSARWRVGIVAVAAPLGDGPVPITSAPASHRPFGFVLSAGRDDRGVYLALVAYGERHPRPGTRSVYERAHKRLHGRYPDQ